MKAVYSRLGGFVLLWCWGIEGCRRSSRLESWGCELSFRLSWLDPDSRWLCFLSYRRFLSGPAALIGLKLQRWRPRLSEFVDRLSAILAPSCCLFLFYPPPRAACWYDTRGGGEFWGRLCI